MKENIWGKEGCLLPSGRLCSACCILPEVEIEGTIVSVGKPANSPCPFLNQNQNGCSLHLKGKNDNCTSWHCSKAGVDGKFDLIAQGLSSGLVTEDIAVDSVLALDKTLGCFDNIRQEVVRRSDELSKITHPRKLVRRDLVEP